MTSSVTSKSRRSISNNTQERQLSLASALMCLYFCLFNARLCLCRPLGHHQLDLMLTGRTTTIYEQNFHLTDRIYSESNKSPPETTKDVSLYTHHLHGGYVTRSVSRGSEINFYKVRQWEDTQRTNSDGRKLEKLIKFYFDKFIENERILNARDATYATPFPQKVKVRENIPENDANLQLLLERYGLDTYTPPIIAKETPETGFFEGLPIRRFDGSMEGPVEEESFDYIYRSDSANTGASIPDSFVPYSPPKNSYALGDPSDMYLPHGPSVHDAANDRMEESSPLTNATIHSNINDSSYFNYNPGGTEIPNKPQKFTELFEEERFSDTDGRNNKRINVFSTRVNDTLLSDEVPFGNTTEYSSTEKYSVDTDIASAMADTLDPITLTSTEKLSSEDASMSSATTGSSEDTTISPTTTEFPENIKRSSTTTESSEYNAMLTTTSESSLNTVMSTATTELPENSKRSSATTESFEDNAILTTTSESSGNTVMLTATTVFSENSKTSSAATESSEDIGVPSTTTEFSENGKTLSTTEELSEDTVTLSPTILIPTKPKSTDNGTIIVTTDSKPALLSPDSSPTSIINLPPRLPSWLKSFFSWIGF